MISNFNVLKISDDFFTLLSIHLSQYYCRVYFGIYEVIKSQIKIL